MSNTVNFNTQRRDFSKYKTLWEHYFLAYLGGLRFKEGGFIKRFLDVETIEEHRYRQANAVYDNEIKWIINNKNKYIFDGQINRDTVENIINESQFSDRDRNNLGVNTYMFTLFNYYLLFGEIYVEIDRFDDKWQWDIIFPQRVTNFESDNRLTEITFTSGFENDIYNHVNDEFTTIKGKEKEDNVFKMCNYKRFTLNTDNYNLGQSLVNDVYDAVIDIYNINSTIDFEINKSSFETIYFPFSERAINLLNKYGKKKTVNGVEVLDMNFSNQRFVFVEPGASVTTNIKDLSYINVKRERVKDIQETIRRLMSQRINELMLASQMSRTIMDRDKNTEIGFFAQMYRKMEIELWQFVKQLENKSPVLTPEMIKTDIIYPKRFDVIDKTEKMKEIAEALNYITTVEARKALEIAMLRLLDESIPEKELKIAIDSIQKAPDSEFNDESTPPFNLDEPVEDDESI